MDQKGKVVVHGKLRRLLAEPAGIPERNIEHPLTIPGHTQKS
ncbi:MAG: hypothetical protein ACMUIA_10300 [bacterium]